MKIHLPNLIQNIIYILLILLVTVSCNKSDSAGIQGKATIQVAIADATFESEETIGNRAATFAEPTIQRNTIELNKDFLMVAELHPQKPVPLPKDGSKAALDTSDLAANIRYRLLVYTQAGAFVAERDYIRGQEASTPALELDGGTTYTFVAFSLNTTTEIPATTPAIATRTLANSRIVVNSGVSALMHYMQTVTLTGNTINRLDIVFKHQKPRINVIINATQAGYNISAIDAVLSPHNSGMIVNLSDGSFTQNGNETLLTFDFGSTVGTQIVSGANNINAPNNTSSIFTIRSITIGSITATNLIPFSNLSVTRGIRYNLILNIVPNDQYLTYQGRPAARINGVIWALHNLGVATTVDAQQTPITSDLHGNFYQFGRNVSVGNGTATTTNANWIPNPPNTAAWNTGTETVPVKTALDPCPAGYRVPTFNEAQALINNTIHSTRGVMTNNATNFNAASVFTSTRAASVQLTFPHQGLFSVTGGTFATFQPTAIMNRGIVGLTHTSRTSGNVLYRFRPSSTGASILETDNGISNYSSATPIRCVGIQ